MIRIDNTTSILWAFAFCMRWANVVLWKVCSLPHWQSLMRCCSDRAGLGILAAVAMGGCSLAYATAQGHSVLIAYRIGLCHTKVHLLNSAAPTTPARMLI